MSDDIMTTSCCSKIQRYRKSYFLRDATFSDSSLKKFRALSVQKFKNMKENSFDDTMSMIKRSVFITAFIIKSFLTFFFENIDNAISKREQTCNIKICVSSNHRSISLFKNSLIFEMNRIK